ncbi:flagellar assembly protein FliW [Paenibacillus sp. 481]|uniref:flagellar assembly protein FliW n=1 Tax=Paenibacillus sp. 481 TaxID=2835869 RepID=UPI001E4BC8E2|nr:flagellar assembly protein FliW [Paenibacillus sp. 481]UHA75710.1 flagellar assembly protein FliW [Paenibacillus sp. 481]
MQIHSTRLGQLDVEETDLFHFVSGILGFQNYKKYVWLPANNSDTPFDLLQSVEDEQLTFILSEPFTFDKDYSFVLNDDWKKKLCIEAEEDISVRVITTVRSPEEITANYRAPLVFNVKKRLGAQIILDGSEYDLKHPITLV